VKAEGLGPSYHARLPRFTEDRLADTFGILLSQSASGVAQDGSGLSGPLLRGTDALIGLVNAITRSGAFPGLGLPDTHLAPPGVFMGIMTVPGTWVASRLVARMGTRVHDRLLETLIASAVSPSLAMQFCISPNHGGIGVWPSYRPDRETVPSQDRQSAAWLRVFRAASCRIVNAGMTGSPLSERCCRMERHFISERWRIMRPGIPRPVVCRGIPG